MKRKSPFNQYPTEDATPLSEMPSKKYHIPFPAQESLSQSTFTLKLHLPSHEEPYVYKSSQFLCECLLEHFTKSHAPPTRILELGAGFNAMPSILCCKYLLGCERRRNLERMRDAEGLTIQMSDGPSFHVYITDGDRAFESMRVLWRDNLRTNLEEFCGKSEGTLSPQDNISTLIDQYCTQSYLKWNNFFSIPQNVDLILAADTIHNRNKDAWEDFFVCVAYCLKKGGYDNDDCKLWMVFQRRDDNETIVHLLEKWGLRAEIIKRKDEEGLLLLEIRSAEKDEE